MKKYSNIFVILALLAITHQARALDTDGEGYYLIGSVQDWKDFAALIETNASANARMTADIDLGSDQTMIGYGYGSDASYRKPFSGVFDGQGHTLTIHYVTASVVNELTDAGLAVHSYLGCAPFRYVMGGTIRNLHTAGTISATHEGIAGIVGWVNGSTLIENCRSSVDLTYTDNHRGIGGIIYMNYDSGALTINDCLYDGTITGGTDHTGAAGFVCYRSNGTININNSLMYGTLVNIGTSDCCTFVRNYSNCTFTNCYYKTVLNVSQGTAATLKELGDGTTVTALQASRGETVWVKDPVLGYPVPQIVASAGPAPATDLMYIAAAGEVTILGFADAFTPPADYALVIPDEIAGMPVVAVGNAAFIDRADFTSLYIGKNVRSIDMDGFRRAAGFATVTFDPECVISSIGESAFRGCGEMTAFVMPNTVTSVGAYVLQANAKLASVTLSSSLAALSVQCLCNCPLLTSIDIPSSVTSIGNYAFRECSGLEEITIPSSVTTIGTNIFYESGAIRELNINCRNIPASLCESKKNLTTVVIGSNVRTIGEYAFSYCEILNSVTFEPGGQLTTIGDKAFRYCYELSEIIIPNTVTTMGGGIFQGDSKLESVTFAGGGKITSLGDNTFNGCTLLDGVIIPTTVTALGSSVFYDCTSLSAITIPASVASMGTNVFYDCNNLSSVTFADGIGITSIPNYTFYHCWPLSGIEIPSSVTSIGEYAFVGDNLTSFTIPSSVTSIGQYAFWSCSKLTSMTIPSSVTTLGNAVFSWCTGLTSVTFEEPCSITDFPNLLFNDCKSLLSVSIPSSVRSIGNQVFRECLAMTEIVIPRNVQTIGTNIVEGCIPLEKLDLSACSDVWNLYNGPIDATTRYEGETKLDYITIILPPGSTATGTDIQTTELGPLAQDAYGWYLINSAEDFNRFAVIARSDPSVNALLEKDIVLTGNELTVGMGYDESHCIAYAGTFDGQGHSITVNFTGHNRFQHQYGGLFSWADGATIQNLWVKGTMETTQKYAGGFVGGIKGTLTFTKCKSSVSLTGFVSTSTEMRLGGFFGQTHSATVSVSDCMTAANILGGSNVTYVGGIGFVANSSTLTMTNCFSMASFDCTSCSMFNWRNSSTLNGTNNLYLADVADADLVAAASAYQTAVSYAQAADGSVAAALDAGGSGGTWVQDPVTNKPNLRLFANPATLALASATAATIFGESKYVTTFYSGAHHYRLPEGAKAYTAELDGTDVVFYQIGEDGRVIPMSNAVIIISDVSSITLTELESTTVAAKYGNILSGSDTEIETPLGTVYVLGVSAGTPKLFVYTGSTIPAGKAYYAE